MQVCIPSAVQVQQKQVWDDAVIQRLIEIDPLVSDDMGFLGKKKVLVVGSTRVWIRLSSISEKHATHHSSHVHKYTYICSICLTRYSFDSYDSYV